MEKKRTLNRRKALVLWTESMVEAGLTKAKITRVVEKYKAKVSPVKIQRMPLAMQDKLMKGLTEGKLLLLSSSGKFRFYDRKAYVKAGATLNKKA